MFNVKKSFFNVNLDWKLPDDDVFQGWNVI